MTIEIGTLVKVIGIPPDVAAHDDSLGTRRAFEAAQGRVFPVIDMHGKLLLLDVGEVFGKTPYNEETGRLGMFDLPICAEPIWIEPEFVELVQT